SSRYDALKARIRGPVFPIPIPFTSDESVDYAAIRTYANFLVEHGAPVLLMTVGTSRFNLLTRDEMMAANAALVEAVDGRAMAVAAGPGPFSGSTRENSAFARHARSIGADAILLVYPERWYGDEPVVGFFNDVAASADIGVMVHAVAMRDGFGGMHARRLMDLALLEKIAAIENVIGVKEENGERAVYEAILAGLNHLLPIIGAGGAMRRFINDAKLGAFTYLVGIGSFRPDLAMTFYRAVMAGDEARATAIAAAYEDPYFAKAVSYGWHRALKETLHVLGLMPPYERAPLDRLKPAECDALRELVHSIGFQKKA
ncbi:MAG: dihydrodipicolinate synthase family protein, partial [Rhodothermales bacterium]|nr:dihydrodipicolinate synthase family protein [Rhodothermales bacterium]